MTEEHACQHQDDPSKHVFVKTVVTTYTKDHEVVESWEVDDELPGDYVSGSEVAAILRGTPAAFSIRSHYDDGCVRDFVEDELDQERRRLRS